MTVAVIILLVAIAIAIAGFTFNAIRVTGQSVDRAVGTSGSAPKRPMPTVVNFHVKGNTARAQFDVPLGDGPPGQHLDDLLSSAAVEYVREKVHEGLPLDGVERIEVFAMRSGEPELITTVDLPEVGTLPELDVMALVSPTHDPIAAVAEVIADTSVATSTSGSSTLEPVNTFIELPGVVEAHLRLIGVDPASMSLEDLVVGLMRVGGYDLQDDNAGFTMSDDRARVYRATRAGKTTELVILPHEIGTHPELDERVLAKFAVGVAQANPDQAVLVTDKYSPYSMYEREKRDKRLVFVTRERLQSFVDSFSVG